MTATNYLITGGAGFIGINFLKYSLSKYPKANFICLDKLTYAANISEIKNLEKFNNFEFVKGSICDRKLIYSLFKKYNFDYVINFAAETSVDRSITHPSIFISTNVKGVQILLDACVKFGIKRFHQISTDEVYGDIPLDSQKKFSENSKLSPSNPYAASKASADLLVLSYNKTFKINTTISRSSNNYGLFQNEEKLIPRLIKSALHNKPMPIYGDGKNKRDWINVSDNCRAIDIILHNGKNGEIYNIASNIIKSNIQIANQIMHLLKKSNNLISFKEDRLGHDKKYSLDTTKMQHEFNWKATSNFNSELETLMNYYKKTFFSYIN